MAVRDCGSLDLWLGLMSAHNEVLGHVADRLEGELGMPVAWYEALARLDDMPGGQMRMQELAASMRLSPSGITRLADRLEEAGYIERSSCATDRRGTNAGITPEGRAAFESAMPVFTRAIGERFEEILSASERNALARILRKLGPPASLRTGDRVGTA